MLIASLLKNILEVAIFLLYTTSIKIKILCLAWLNIKYLLNWHMVVS